MELASGRSTEAQTPRPIRRLDYVAQGKGRTWDSARYRFEGCYRDYFLDPNIKLKAMYDKLSDRRMKQDFAITLSQTSVQVDTGDLLARRIQLEGLLNGRVRVNDFQTVKQELPLLEFNQRPFPSWSIAICPTQHL